MLVYMAIHPQVLNIVSLSLISLFTFGHNNFCTVYVQQSISNIPKIIYTVYILGMLQLDCRTKTVQNVNIYTVELA